MIQRYLKKKKDNYKTYNHEYFENVDIMLMPICERNKIRTNNAISIQYNTMRVSFAIHT